VTARELVTGLRYGSPDGPAIEINWEARTVVLHNMSPRLVRRITGWLLLGEKRGKLSSPPGERSR
jgi:hypothetical protein